MVQVNVENLEDVQFVIRSIPSLYMLMSCSNANNVRLQSLENNEASSDVSHEVVQNASYDVVNVSLETNVSDQILLTVIPVTVNNSHSSLALLDNASTNSFCSEKFAKSFVLKGKEKR